MNARTDWQAHDDQLDRVAASTEERDEVRRILGADPLAEHELDTHVRHVRAAAYPIRYRACANGPCAKGRKLCPTPQACHVSDAADAERPPLQRGDGPRVLAMLGLAAAIVLGIAAAGVWL